MDCFTTHILTSYGHIRQGALSKFFSCQKRKGNQIWLLPEVQITINRIYKGQKSQYMYFIGNIFELIFP